MKPTGRTQLVHGVYAALATPRRKNVAQPDTAALLDYLDAIAKTGVDGLVLFGATGEFIHFDIEDRMLTLNLAAKRSRVPILVNVSHSTLDGALALAEDAIDRGVAGVLILAPYFYRYNDRDLEEFFTRFVTGVAGRVPIYLYNLPQFGNAISADVARRLFQTGQIAGIKDSSGSWASYEALNAIRADAPFQLLGGHERLYLRQQMGPGVDGVVSGISAALPELIVALSRSIAEGNMERATGLDAYVQNFISQIEQFATPVGIKQTAVFRGWPLGEFAVPLSTESATVLDGFRQWLTEWLPTVLRECAASSSSGH